MSAPAGPAPLVLLHPFPLDGRFWDPLRPHLEEGGRVVVAPDFPGLGAAPPESEAAPSVDGFADRVAERIGGELPGGRAVVAGLSMGGYVALALAARHPERLRGLVLISTRAEPDDAAGLARRAEGARQVRQDGLPAFLEAFMPALTAPDAPPTVVSAMRDLAAGQRPEAVAQTLEALAERGDRRPDLASIDVPALVVSGSEDPVTTPAMMRALAEGLPCAELVSLVGAGHLLARERPRELLDAMLPFLAARDAEPAA